MNQVVIFNTHKVIKKFIEVGFTERQAEVIADEQKAILENNLATKQDLAEINHKIESLRLETKKDIESLKKDIELMTNRFTNKMYIAILSSIGFFITIMKLLQLS